ncbi:hypothetical protein AAZX31_14G134400 [Glycine max]
MLMHNIGDLVHQLVIDTRIIPILVKIVKKKCDSGTFAGLLLCLQQVLGNSEWKDWYLSV